MSSNGDILVPAGAFTVISQLRIKRESSAPLRRDPRSEWSGAARWHLHSSPSEPELALLLRCMNSPIVGQLPPGWVPIDRCIIRCCGRDDVFTLYTIRPLLNMIPTWQATRKIWTKLWPSSSQIQDNKPDKSETLYYSHNPNSNIHPICYQVVC